MTTETFKKALELYDEIEYLENPDRYAPFSRAIDNPESIYKIDRIRVIAGDFSLEFKRDSDEFIQLKGLFMGDYAKRINRIAELEKQLAEL